MASAGNIALFKQSAVAATANGETKSAEIRQRDFILWAGASNTAGGDFTITLEHSGDGANWESADPGSVALVGNTAGSLRVTGSLLPNVRAVITRNAGTSDLDVRLYFDR